MSNDKYREALSDAICEINLILEENSGDNDTEFKRGYRAGVRVISKVIEDMISSFGITSSELDQKLIDVDRWFAGRT